MSGATRLPRLLSVRVVADQTTLPISTIYDAIYRGDLPVVRIGRSVRLDERDVVTFIAARKESDHKTPPHSTFSTVVESQSHPRARRARPAGAGDGQLGAARR